MRTRVTLRRGSWERRTIVDVPAGPCRPADVVPALHQLADAVSPAGTVEVSCGPACGVCCRQLVPVAIPEVGFLQDVVAGQSCERQHQIRRAAAQADEALRVNGFGRADELCERTAREARALGQRWFRLGLPCPFLVEESCSIHEHRPLACREYLVTSPPSACATLGRGLVERITPPVSLWSRVIRSGSARPRWLPLSAAVTSEVESGERVAGPDLLRHLLAASPAPGQRSEATTPTDR